MVAAKAAAAAPQRVASLTLLGYTLNGWQMAASLVTNPQQLFKVSSLFLTFLMTLGSTPSGWQVAASLTTSHQRLFRVCRNPVVQLWLFLQRVERRASIEGCCSSKRRCRRQPEAAPLFECSVLEPKFVTFCTKDH